MPRHKRAPYLCPACGYATAQKSHMRQHFYDVKNECPKTVNDIDLTDEIKEFVLKNRVYHVPKPLPPVQTINNNYGQIINNNKVINHINNIICNMDAVERIQTLVERTQVSLLPMEDKIEGLYGNLGNLLTLDAQDPEYPSDHRLTRDDIYDVIDAVSKMNETDCSDVGYLYDDKLQKLHIREGDAWNMSRFDQGVRKIIEMLQTTYLDNYEAFLVQRVLQDPGFQTRQHCEELLRLYYGFLESFDLQPFVQTSDNSELDDMLCSPEVRQRFQDLFMKARRELRKVQRDKYMRDVRDIIVRNAKQNKSEISRRLLDLVKADEEFKAMIMARPTSSLVDAAPVAAPASFAAS